MAQDQGPVEEARGFRIEGRVQGVGFRWWTVRTAHFLGLRGWVMNLPGGAVEVHASGSAEALDRMREQLGLGPSGSRVDGVADVLASGDLPPSGFEIR